MDAPRSVLKDRWWPVPGLLAVLGTLVLVALTQGWVRTSPVVLPRAVQIGAPRHTSLVHTTSTTSSAAAGTVVPAAHLVVSEPGDQGVAAPTTVPPAVPAPGVSPGAANSGAAASLGGPSAQGGVGTTTTTLPASPASSTTTTTAPRSTTTTDDGSEGSDGSVDN